MPVDAKGEEKNAESMQWPTVPRRGNVSLNLSRQETFNKEFEISQFGIVFGLNPSVFSDRKESPYAVFDPSTGALKEIGPAKLAQE